MTLKGSVSFSDRKYTRSREKLQPFKLKMIELVGAQKPGLMLDIGCGTGVVSEMLKKRGWKVYGLDIAYEGIRRYFNKGLCGIVADAENILPFNNGCFEAVWLSEVLEHLVDYKGFLSEINRILKPSGRLYITTPNSVFFGYRLLYMLGRCPTELQHPYHVRFFSPEFLSRTLMESGFKLVIRLGQNVYFFFPEILVRAMERLNKDFAKRLMKMIGIREVEGLIHGNKYLIYKFSSFFPSFFGNTILMVGEKQS